MAIPLSKTGLKLVGFARVCYGVVKWTKGEKKKEVRILEEKGIQFGGGWAHAAVLWGTHVRL